MGSTVMRLELMLTGDIISGGPSGDIIGDAHGAQSKTLCRIGIALPRSHVTHTPSSLIDQFTDFHTPPSPLQRHPHPTGAVVFMVIKIISVLSQTWLCTQMLVHTTKW